MMEKGKLSFIKKLEFFFFRFQKIKLDEKIFFAKNLAVMIKSGISLSQSLEVLTKQTKNKKFQAIIKNIQGEIESGNSFFKSLSQYPDIFSEVFIGMVEAGEKSGQLEKVLKEISIQLKKTRSIISKIRRSLIYPIFVVSVMILLGIFMLTFIIPKMMDFFLEMEMDLPLPTKILIFTSNFLVKHWHILLGLVLFAIFFFRKIMKTKRGKYFFHNFFLKLLVIGEFLKKVNLIKFSRTFSSLLSSGVPLIQTLQITSRILNNVVYQEKIIKVSKEITKGTTIYSHFQKYPELFPPLITQMIEIGEKTGNLENILEEVIQFYEDDVDEVLANFTSIIEPVLIVLIGFGIGFMAIAIILPMYSMSAGL